MAIWYNVWPFGIMYGHLVYFGVILVYFSRFGMLYHEKSGNPGSSSKLITGCVWQIPVAKSAKNIEI
jgi:hypothetical protein